MLDGLDDIDWSSLEHAYGAADDVPDLLRSLVSPDKDERDEALNELFGNVWHQGTVYSATPHVVPFLVELLEKDAAPDRDGVLMLFTLIAGGSGYLEVHAEISGKEEAEFEAELQEERRTVEFVRDACRLHLDLLLPCLTHPEADLRMEAARALAKYPENRHAYLPLLEAALESEDDEDVHAAIEESIRLLR